MSTILETQFTCETLSLDQWESLRPIFNDEFDSDLPHYKYGAILGIKADGKLIGFVSLESALLLNLPYIKEEYRHGDASKVLFNFAENVLRSQKDRPIIILTEQGKREQLMKSYSMRDVGQAWRLDNA